MKIIVSFLLVLSIAASTLVTGSKSSATNVAVNQSPNGNPNAAAKSNRYRQKLPRNAIPGSTDERRAAWEGLTAAQKQRLIQKIRKNDQRLNDLANKLETPSEDDEPLPSSLIDRRGRREERALRRLKKSDARLLERLSSYIAPGKPEQRSAIPGDRAVNQAFRHHARPNRTQSTKGIDEFVRNAFPDLSMRTNGQEMLSWRNQQAASGPLLNSTSRKTLGLPAQTGDSDGDGLPDGFENQVADSFTPYYHVSTEEPDHFAFFGDYLPETVIQTVSPYQPISHFRVTPLGFSADHTQAYLRIDYWTLWDHDSGFQYGFFCESTLNSLHNYISEQIIGLVDVVVQQLSDHPLDNERSAILVSAPVADPNNPTFSSDATAYSMLAFFLSAHENQLGDRSAIYYPSQPIPATGPSHIEMTLARSKHAHDLFRPDDPSYPDGLPLVPGWIIVSAYAYVDQRFFLGLICFEEWLALQYLLDVTFFSCIVEHFGNSGGTFANTRINVGEVNQPINGCHFIQGGELYTKMTTAIPW